MATHHRESPQKAAPPPGTEHYYVTLTLTRLVITVMYCELVGRGSMVKGQCLTGHVSWWAEAGKGSLPHVLDLVCAITCLAKV